MKFRPRNTKKKSNPLRWMAMAALTTAVVGAIFRFFGTSFSIIPIGSRFTNQGSPGNKRYSMHSSDSVIFQEELLRENLEQGVVTPLQFKGRDILLVVGSDGHHPLDNHSTEIRANREDYAAYHGTDIQLVMLISGYDFMWANLSDYRVEDAHAVWAKVSVLLEAFKQHPEAKWIWWLDFDAVIMTPTVDLGEHILNPDAMFSKLLKGEKFPIVHLGQSEKEELKLPLHPDPNEINLLISHDQNGLNAGSFFLRRNTWTEMFLELWHDPIFMLEKKWWALEQDALIHILLKHHRFMENHVGIVAQREFNAYAPDDINKESLGDSNIGFKAEFWDADALVIHFAGCW
jgi:hypothetical protein